MKPVLKEKLAVFSPQGFLDGGNASSVIEPNDVDFVINSKSEIILVSLKKIIFFNQRGLSIVLESLQKMSNKLGAMIGFCDYDEKKYKMIMDIYHGHVPFTLLDSQEIGELFAGVGKKSENKKVLIYSDDIEQRNRIVMELYELGYEAVTSPDMGDFEKQKDSYDFCIKHSYLGSSDRIIHVHIRDNVVIYTLKDFLDSSLADNFDDEHHQNALKIGFNYFLFDAEKVSSTNIHAVNFISKLSTAGAEYGATIAISGLNEKNITDALRNDLEDAGILIYEKIDDFFSDSDILGEDGGGALSGKKPRHITKKLVEVLPIVMETTLKTIESMLHENLVRKDIKVQDLLWEKDIKSYAVAIAFYGQIEGMMVLAFEEELAKKTCKVLLDDDAGSTQILVALGELVNIIGGKLTQQMKRKNYNIDITMPRTYKNIDELMAHKKGTKGAQVNFEVEGKPIALFLTK